MTAITQAVFNVSIAPDTLQAPAPLVEGATPDNSLTVGQDFTLVVPAFINPSYQQVMFAFNASTSPAGIYSRPVTFVSGQPTRQLITQDDIPPGREYVAGDVARVTAFALMPSIGWLAIGESEPYTFKA